MKAVDMLKLCEYLTALPRDEYDDIEIYATPFGDLVVSDYYCELSVADMDSLGCDWEPSINGFKVRETE